MYKSKTIFFLNDQKLILLKLFFWTEELLSFLFIWVGKTTYFISIGTFHLNRLSVFFWRHIWAGTFVPGLIFWLFCFHRFFFNITFFVAKKVWEFVELISKLVHQCYIIWANRFTCILIVKVVRQRERTVNWYFSNFFPKNIFKMFEFDFFLWKVNHFFQSK